MNIYWRQIKRLRKAIPDEPMCPEGCFTCCMTPVAWSWTEWLMVPVELRKVARLNPRFQMCPFASPWGCKVYQYRPICCRIAGKMDDMLSPQGGLVKMACPLGVEPERKLSDEDGKTIFMEWVEILKKEFDDTINSGCYPLPAGPFGILYHQPPSNWEPQERIIR